VYRRKPAGLEALCLQQGFKEAARAGTDGNAPLSFHGRRLLNTEANRYAEADSFFLQEEHGKRGLR
jgi:hypothetical protein